MKKGEYILCAALMHNGTIVSGHRHSDCYAVIINLTNHKENLPEREQQGFLTSIGRFVDRSEAYQIALVNNQLLLPHEEGCIEQLISENLY